VAIGFATPRHCGRLEAKRLAVARFGFLESTLVEKDIAEIVMRLGIMRFETEGHAIADLGLLKPTLLVQDIAKVTVGFGHVRL
jgi:hypothetical protein